MHRGCFKTNTKKIQERDRSENVRFLQDSQRATLNMLEDFDEERRHLQVVQKATLNLLEDINDERTLADDTTRALLNILDDFDEERTKTEQVLALLQVANKELETFSYSVSHDLRAPLRSIDGFSQILLEDYQDKLDEEGQDNLRRVRAASQRMGVLIDDILKLSRISRFDMHRQPVDLSRLAGEIAEDLKAEYPKRRIDFKITSGLVTHGDAHLLRIVLENLLGNAAKFTGNRKEAIIQFGSQEKKSGPAIYFVRDNGAGFNMKYAKNLFGVFQRLHKSSDFPGTGVGLATVKRILSRHQGQIWAESVEGKGTTFYFTTELERRDPHERENDLAGGGQS